MHLVELVLPRGFKREPLVRTMSESKALNDWVRGDCDFIVLKIAVHHLFVKRENREHYGVANVPVVLLSNEVPDRIEEGIDIVFIFVLKRRQRDSEVMLQLEGERRI